MCRVVKDGEEWWMEKSDYLKLGRHKREVIPRAREIARDQEPCILEVMTTDGRLAFKNLYPDDLPESLSIDKLFNSIDNRRTRR